MHRDLIELIDAVLADGVVTAKERAVLHRKAAALGVDADEVDIFVDARLHLARPEAAESCAVCGASGSMLDRVCTHCGHRIGEPSGESGPDIHASLRRIEEHLAELKSIPLPGSPAHGMQTQAHHLQAQAAFNPFARLMLAGRTAGQATAGPPDARYEKSLAQIAKERRLLSTYFGADPKLERVLQEIDVDVRSRQSAWDDAVRMQRYILIAVLGGLLAILFLCWVTLQFRS